MWALDWVGSAAPRVGRCGQGLTTRALASVTAPVSAKTRPVTLVPVVTVSLMFARMLPSRAELVPRVAELPTCQKTFPAVAPLARTTEELLAVVSVVPIL